MKHILFFLLGISIGVAALADGVAPPSPLVRTTGRAVITNEDVSGARDRAVKAGLLRAVEQYAGLRLEASTIIKRGELIDRQIKSRAKGFVKSYKLTGETRQGNELVVKLDVQVAAEPMAESFRQALSSTSTLLLIAESNLGKSIEGQILPVVLADPFFTSRVLVAKPSDLQKAKSRIPKTFYKNPDIQSVRELGLSQTCGIVIVAWADTRQLDSGKESIGYAVDASVLRPVVAAEGNLVIFSADSGHVIASRRFDDIRASDASDSQRAGVAALHKLANEMRKTVIAKVSEYLKESGYKLNVKVVATNPKVRAARVATILKETRWVENATIVAQDAKSATIEATCIENPMYVVEQLKRSPEIKVTKFDLSKATVEIR